MISGRDGRLKFLLELREAHRFHRNPKDVDDPIFVGDIVIVHDENMPRGLWKLGRVEDVADPATECQARLPDLPDSPHVSYETSVDTAEPRDKRPRCQAFCRAQDTIRACCSEES